MSSLLLSPSPNWFQSNTLSTRSSDNILATASFKCIVIYEIPEKNGALQSKKMITLNGKATCVCLYPNSSDSSLGAAVAVIMDTKSLSIFNYLSGETIMQHQPVTKVTLNAVCWSNIAGEPVLVAVGAKGNKGFLCVWKSNSQSMRSYDDFENYNEMSIIQSVAQVDGQVLVASGKSILLISIITGKVLSNFRGHERDIYCICWLDAPPEDVENGVKDENKNGKECKEESNGLSETPIWRRPSASPSFLSSGPLFATSDLGRNVLVWDTRKHTYLRRFKVNRSFHDKKKEMDKDRNGHVRNHHIALAASGGVLYSSSVIGELLKWELGLKESVPKLLLQPHLRPIYSLAMNGSNLISSGQDRLLCVTDVKTESLVVSTATMGVAANSMAFSPHDANRLAVGMQDDSLLLVTLAATAADEMPRTHKINLIKQNLRGRILALCWHPVSESKLLVGTSEGQVCVVDIFQKSTTSFARFHKKAVYKVEWGKAPAPQKTGLREDDWCAYSFGDRELLCRSANDPMQEPLAVESMLGLGVAGVTTAGGFSITEFAFSPDQQILVVGSVNGEIRLFDRLTLRWLIQITCVRKSIQHLCWRPPQTGSGQEDERVLAVATAENAVSLFHISQYLNKVESNGNSDTVSPDCLPVASQPVIVQRACRELSSHSARVVWLSWSTHEKDILASCSYDHTVQIWNAQTGEAIKNYGEHGHRVFRVEFSPTWPDLVFSLAEENSLHMWRPSKLVTRTSTQSTASLKELRKKGKCSLITQKKSDNTTNETNNTIEKIVPSASKTASTNSRKSSNRKSSFPLLHEAASRKKSFHHACILTLSEVVEDNLQTNKENVDDEELEDEICETDKPAESTSSGIVATESSVSRALAKFWPMLATEEPPTAEDMLSYLDFFAPLPNLDAIVSKEIANHDATNYSSRADLMSAWRGSSLESRIRQAANERTLTPFLVASAPQVSFSMWEFACEAYAEQLIKEDEPIVAATYLLNIHKDEEAVELLIRNRFLREALAIVRLRLGFNSQLVNRVLASWASLAVFEGNFELSAILHLCLGDRESAGRCLSRRSEVRSLCVAALLLNAAGKTAVANSTAVAAFKEAASKNEYFKFKPIINFMPHLHWCECIASCQQSLLCHLDAFKSPSSAINDSASEKSDSDCQSVEINDIIDGTKNLSIDGMKNGHVSLNGETTLSNLEETVKDRWQNLGITVDKYDHYLEQINENLVAQSTATSLKQLWFFISISVSKLLLRRGLLNSSEATDDTSHLTDILNCVTTWGKMDQSYYLSHILLPDGVVDLSHLEKFVDISKCEAKVSELRRLYVSSEVSSAEDILNNDNNATLWPIEELQNDSSHIDVNVENISNGITENGSAAKPSDLSKQLKIPLKEVKLFSSQEEFMSTIESYCSEPLIILMDADIRQRLAKLARSLNERNAISDSTFSSAIQTLNSIS